MQTNTTAAKRAGDIKLDGVKVEMTMQDTTIAVVRLTDAAGNFVEFHRSAYDGVRAYVQAPPKTKKAYRVTGTLAGIPVNEVYTHERDAEERKEQLSQFGAKDAAKSCAEVPDESETLEDLPF